MTASVAWVRKFDTGQEELVVASDSRISGGLRFDAAPKVLPFGRGDCVLAFAGEVEFAYPLMIQLHSVVSAWRPARTRSLDIESLRNHLIRVFSDMLSRSLHSVADPDMLNPDLSFLFGGYSYVRKRFELFVAVRNAETSAFEWRDAKVIDGRSGYIAFIGDGAGELESRVEDLIGLDTRQGGDEGPWRWEPLQALRDLCSNADASATVGGAPQVVKVHQHANTTDVPVFWPPGQRERIALRGRPLLESERVDGKALCLETFQLLTVPGG